MNENTTAKNYVENVPSDRWIEFIDEFSNDKVNTGAVQNYDQLTKYAESEKGERTYRRHHIICSQLLFWCLFDLYLHIN